MSLELHMVLATLLALGMPLTAWAVIVWMERRDARQQRQQESGRKADPA